MRGSSCVAEDLLAPQEGLCSMELVISFTTHIGMHNKINTENVPSGSSTVPYGQKEDKTDREQTVPKNFTL